MFSILRCRSELSSESRKYSDLIFRTIMALLSATLITGCSSFHPQVGADRAAPLRELPEEINISEILGGANREAASAGFLQESLTSAPDDLKLLRQLVRHPQTSEDAAAKIQISRRIAEHAGATEAEKIEFATLLLKSGDVAGADQALTKVSVKTQAAQFYLLKAVISDTKSDWTSADRFYRLAVDRGGTTAALLNNWGYSNLRRGDFDVAEGRFASALRLEPDLFEAKANLATARASRGNYTLPPVEMNQLERAELLYTIASVAARNGDTAMARHLLNDAIETHPQYFEAAVRSLQALGS